jgi:fructose/tagatose bisphosphate aldolase
MFDDSHSPFAANVENSIAYRKFLEAQRAPKVLEGCLEEVAAGGEGVEASPFTDPARIEEYLERTGFDLVVPNIGTESVNARPVGVQWQVLEAIQKRGVGPRLVVHGYSSIRSLAIDDQRRLGRLGVVAMNAWSYIPQEIGRACLERAAKIREGHDPQRGYPVDFDAAGRPIYQPSRDANVFFGPILDQVRDFKVESIAESVYRILESLGYERVG